MTSDAQPSMYTTLAPWFHLITAPADYEEEAAIYRREFVAACEGELRTMLELGSGGGNNASHLKQHFAMTLTDLSPEMLALSRTINPELEHVEGDMRTLRLDRTFDAVFAHDATSYLASEADVAAAAETAFVHLRPGGAALFAPDAIRETYRPGTDHGGHDGDDGRAVRYLEWDWDPDPDDTTYTTDYAYVLRSPDGTVRVEHDRHTLGLLSRETWLRLLREAGFVAETRPFVHSETEPGEIFIAKRPA